LNHDIKFSSYKNSEKPRAFYGNEWNLKQDKVYMLFSKN